MRKKYNPFKMWGSWVGAVIGIIAQFMGFTFITGYIQKLLGLMSNSIFFLIFNWAVSIILGFLLGWGIHALIRRYK